MSTFPYFGEELAYADEFPAFEYAEFQEALAEDEVNDAHATGVALRLAVACVAEKDRGKFRKLSRQNRAKVPDWLRVYRDWTADAAERPTGQPTDSSDGRTDTEPSSDTEPVATVTSIGQAPQPQRRGDLALAASRSRAV